MDKREAVARAICESRMRLHFESERKAGVFDATTEMPDDIVAGVVEKNWRKYLPDADAAVAAWHMSINQELKAKLGIERQQKLIDIMFEIAMRIRAQMVPMRSADDLATWIANQLRDCGFPVKPMGSSWGVLDCGDGIALRSVAHPSSDKVEVVTPERTD